MLGLHTARGIDLHDLESILPESSSFSSLRAIIDSLIHRNLLQLRHNRLSLTPSGLSLADEVIRELMFV
jgi:coproporphyrinogen III oxidase-like Fe-S oxidoreductase